MVNPEKENIVSGPGVENQQIFGQNLRPENIQVTNIGAEVPPELARQLESQTVAGPIVETRHDVSAALGSGAATKPQPETRLAASSPVKSKEAAEAAPETPPKIPSMSVEKFLKSKASNEDKEKRIRQLNSGTAYRIENGKRVQVTVGIEKDGQGNYKDEATVTKIVDGKPETKKVKLSALKLQIWERDKSEKGKPLLEQNKNVTYRHQDGTVTDKMKFLGHNSTIGKHWFRKEPNGQPFTVAPQDVRVCRERNKDGTIKENGTFAITRKVAPALPKEKLGTSPAAEVTASKEGADTTAGIEGAAEADETGDTSPEARAGKEKAGEGTNEQEENGEQSEEDVENSEVLAKKAIDKLTPKEYEALRQHLEKPGVMKRVGQWLENHWAGVTATNGGIVAGGVLAIALAATGVVSGVAPPLALMAVGGAAGYGLYRAGKWGWHKMKGLWRRWRGQGNEEEEGEEEAVGRPASGTPRKPSLKKPEGEPEYAWLNLNDKKQRTIEELQALRVPRVAWKDKDGTYYGTLSNPVEAVQREGKPGKWVNVAACYREDKDGSLIPTKDEWIPLAEEKPKKKIEAGPAATPRKPEKPAAVPAKPAAQAEPEAAPVKPAVRAKLAAVPTKKPIKKPEQVASDVKKEVAPPVDLSQVQIALQGKKEEELIQLKKDFENLGNGGIQRNSIEGQFQKGSEALKVVMSALDKKQGGRILVEIERLLASAQFPNLIRVIRTKSPKDQQEVAKAIERYSEQKGDVYPVPLRSQGIEIDSPAGREIVTAVTDEASRKNLLKVLRG